MEGIVMGTGGAIRIGIGKGNVVGCVDFPRRLSSLWFHCVRNAFFGGDVVTLKRKLNVPMIVPHWESSAVSSFVP